MTDQDRKAARREIADALLKALERRHEIADVVVESENKAAAVESIVKLLDTSHLAAEAVMGMCFEQLTIDSRRKILAELEDLNKQLSFTLGERPASSGESVELRPFSADQDRDLFATRTEEIGAAGDGSGGPAGDLDDEIRAALRR
ncbi:GNAT family N-acetyltransferase, partial [Mycobacterium montefiorense]